MKLAPSLTTTLLNTLQRYIASTNKLVVITVRGRVKLAASYLPYDRVYSFVSDSLAYSIVRLEYYPFFCSGRNLVSHSNGQKNTVWKFSKANGWNCL